ncbi:MAG: DinB family protein [Acidobacteriota bacterium]
MIAESTLLRLETQLEVIPVLLNGATPEAVLFSTRSGKWSAHENLAHLARHHAVFLERLNRILAEDAPELDRYRAENDSAWSEWSCLSTDEVLSRLKHLRAQIIRFIKELSEDETNRVGIHPLFGEMRLSLWIEFFLLHEAHHLYVVMTRLGEARSSLAK